MVKNPQVDPSMKLNNSKLVCPEFRTINDYLYLTSTLFCLVFSFPLKPGFSLLIIGSD